MHLLKCPFDLSYVGKTKRQPRTSICEPQYDIKRNDDRSPVARHYNATGYDVNTLSFMGLEIVNRAQRGEDDEIQLLKRTAWCIFSLNMNRIGIGIE